ncbi:MAG TPA: kelch repeat-containing protein [Bacteroidia bacterium]|jgi:N-acetylneuraminic acid mutarotase|nr:kelch repeat-containing protein [Bacteroidia bacterium]
MKKLLLLFIVYTTSFATIKAQGTWAPRAPLPDTITAQGISGFSVNGYGYGGLGNDQYDFNKLSDKLWRFDPSSNSWAQMASFPGSARVAPACFVICNKAYLVTGSVASDGKCVKECWEYDATANQWTRKTDFLGGARTYAVGFSINGIGYVGTGANEVSDFYKDFFSYNPITDKWAQIADFGGIARDGDCGFAANGKGYVCFGQDSTIKNHNDMWEYDPVLNTWSQKSNSPGPGLLGAIGFSICDNIYVGSGDSTSAFLADDHRFWRYNTSLDSWTREANIPPPTRIQGTAFAIGDTGYYGFGFDSTGSILDNIFDSFFAGDTCTNIDTCSINTGYDNIADNSIISIYPNPFSDVCYIKLPRNAGNTTVFSLLDIAGIKQEADIKGNGTNYTLERNGLKDGVYILTIKYNEQVLHKKIIIIN